MNSKKYKTTGKISLFDQEIQKEKLSKIGNPLEKLHKVIDFLKQDFRLHSAKNASIFCSHLHEN